MIISENIDLNLVPQFDFSKIRTNPVNHDDNHIAVEMLNTAVDDDSNAVLVVVVDGC